MADLVSLALEAVVIIIGTAALVVSVVSVAYIILGK